MIDIRLPPQWTGTEKEQLRQAHTYLFQLAQQLQWALENVDTSNTVVVAPTPKSVVSTIGSGDAQATFSSIKSLIIKSADIVDAYYDTIHDRLSGKYVAVSDFGKFSEQTTQDITKSSTRIDNAFSNMQSIETNVQDISTSVEEVKTGIDSNLQALTDDIGQLDTALNEAKGNINSNIQDIKSEIESLEFALVEVNAKIRSGLLYTDEDGTPVYGLEIGQKNIVDGVEVFNKYARFTSDRLSFYDQNGSEVAYISDYKLYITHVEIKGTLMAGAYVINTSNGLAFKRVGRR